MDDPLLAVPGTRRPRAEVEVLRLRLARLVERDPADAVARGALDAARWTLHEIAPGPLSPDRAADVVGVEAEWEQSRGVALGVRTGDQARAAGVRAWLEWWLCMSAPPAWMALIRRPR